MSQKEAESIPVKNLKAEEGSEELVNSPDMRPYVQLAVATLQRADVRPHLEEISRLPLEKRYTWRVASALKWGFADFDDFNVIVDRETLGPEDLAKLVDLLKLRPIQFCLFLKALVGGEQMERLVTEAVVCAKQRS